AAEVIQEQGASGMRDMGRVMGELMPRLQGRADGKLTSQVVRELLQG
ncbi:MAG: GatB/YqeY domain-containing protein, partial [Chloroflexota bacterium]